MKILVVDDSRFSQLITEKFLRNILPGADFFLASNGQEGFEKYKDLKPDYSFVDLLMPVINGQEMIKLIREYDEEAKIFVVSADVQKSVKEEMKNYGIIEFINKPFDKEKAELVLELIQGDKND